MKKLVIILASLMVSFTHLLAQHGDAPPQRVCGTLQHHEYLKQTRPNYEADLVQYNQVIEQYLQNKANDLAIGKVAAGSPTVIPVVVHVVYRTAVPATSITLSQAASQVQVLNDDFARLNADANKVTQPTFSTVASGANIRFCLAQRDPNGNPTTGVDYRATTTVSFSTDDKVKSAATGGADPWDVTKYVNIWVCDLGSQLLGYGEFPTGAISNTWGLVLHYKYTGSGGSAVAPYNLGRTGTHEFGHCFNLYHIWGDDGTACSGSDQVADTPNQAGEHYGCFTAGSIQTDACATASPGTMWMNYMDYTDDACMYMFTAGQVARMEAVVSTAPWNVLQSSLGCTPVNALDAGIASVISPANGSSTCDNSTTPKVTLTNAGSTTLTSAIINYKMDALATQTLAWSGSLATSASTVLTLNTYSGLSAAAHTFSVWVTAPNGGVDGNSANNSMSSTFTVASAPVGQALPLVEGFESGTTPPAGWTILKANTVDATKSWSVIANTTGLTAGSTRVAKMDNYTSASNMTGQLDALRTPALTFTAANTSLSLTFDVSHRYYGGTYADTLNVYISSDCGGTWTKLYGKGGTQLTTAGTGTAAYTPTTSTQWRKETVSLSSYAGLSSVYLKFENRSGWGNNLYLDNINITYTPTATAPVANFSTAVSSACSSSSVQLTDMSTNSPTSWSWSVTPTAVISNATVQNPSITFANAGTYSITLTASNTAGSSSITKTISITATPTVAANNATICSGSSATLIATGATSYTWNPGATISSSIIVTPTANTIYTVTGANGACVNTKNVSVTVNSNPTVTVNSPSLCAGASVTLTATGATSYLWDTGATTSSIAVSPSVTTNYTVTGTTATCPSIKIATVTVNALPTVSVVSNGTITCTITTANLIASGASTYSWTGTGIVSGAATPTVIVNTAGTYTVRGTSAAGCTNTAVGSVVANTIVPNGSISPNSSLCVGAGTTLVVTSTTTPVTYLWNTGASSTTIAVTPTVTTPYAATVTNTSNGCKTSLTSTVTVNALPNVAVSSATICAGSTTTLVASGASTYTWNTGANGSSIAVSPTVATNYTVTGTSAAGCVKSATASVSVGSAPSIAVNSTSVCAGTTATLSASGVNTYTWNTGANTSSIIVTPSTTTVYTVTGNLVGCATVASQSATVNVVANPTVVVSSTSVCAGNAVTLNASGATSYSWSTGAISASISVTPSITTVYTVSGSSLGCSNVKTATVTVVANPTVSVASKTVCSGSSATLTATGATTYSWSTGATTSSVSLTPSITTVYTVTGTSATCVNTKTASVTVNTTPVANAGIGGTITCLTNTLSLNGSGVTTYTWSGPGIVSGANTANPIVNASGTYTLVGSTSGCNSSPVTVSVASNTTAPTLTVSANSAICIGNSQTISASSSSPVVYNWNTGASTASILVTPSVSTTYTAIVTNTITGCSKSGVVTVSVNALPNVSATSATICAGSSATLTASGASTYTWNTSATGSSIIVNPTTNTSYTVAGTSAAGCVNYTTASVSVGSAPAIVVNSTSVCAGNTATLSASGVTTYTWNTGSNSASIVVTPTATTVYSVTGNLTGCGTTASSSASVVVNNLPVVSLGALVSPMCVNSPSVTLTGSPAGGVYSGSGVSGNVFDPSASGAGTITVNYLYTDANSCSASASQTVEVSMCTGITEVDNASIVVFPNPTKDILNIKLDASLINTATVELYDGLGKLVIQEKVTNETTVLSLRYLADGVYSVRVVSENRTPMVIRIIKG